MAGTLPMIQPNSNDADADAFDVQRAHRLPHCLGELVIADVLDGWPGRTSGRQRPDGQVKVWQFADDLGRTPVGEFQARVFEHLLGHAGSSGVALVDGGVDVIGGRQLDHSGEIGHQAQALGSTPEREPDQAAVPHHPARLNQRAFASLPDPVETGGNIEPVLLKRQREHVPDSEVACWGTGTGYCDQRLRGIQPRHGGSAASRDAGRVAGAACDVQQFRSRPNAGPVK